MRNIIKFFIYFVPWIACSPRSLITIVLCVWITALNNKTLNYSMKNSTIIKALFSQVYKIMYVIWGVIWKKLYFNITLRCFYICTNISFIFCDLVEFIDAVDVDDSVLLLLVFIESFVLLL